MRKRKNNLKILEGENNFCSTTTSAETYPIVSCTDEDVLGEEAECLRIRSKTQLNKQYK